MRDEFDYFFDVFADYGDRPLTRRFQIPKWKYDELSAPLISKLEGVTICLVLVDNSKCAVRLSEYSGWKLFKKPRKVDPNMEPPVTADLNNPLNDESVYDNPLL